MLKNIELERKNVGCLFVNGAFGGKQELTDLYEDKPSVVSRFLKRKTIISEKKLIEKRR